MRTLVVIAAVIALAAICAAAPANGTNSIFVFAGNTSNGALWSPPVFDEAEGKCKYSKNKALYVTANVTVNGTAIAPFALQALFDGSWAASARIYVYSASVDPAQPCLGIESWDFIAAQRYQTVIALRPGRHSIVVTGVAIGNGSTPGSGTFVVRLIPTRGLLNTANSSVVWRPPVLRRPFNCQQQQAAPRPFLHQTVTVEASGHFAFNVYSSGLPSEVNTTVWVFAGTFTIANGSVANSCEAKFVSGSTTPLMVASPIVNVTKGETYTVAVEFEHPDNRSFWSLSVEPMEVVNTNHTQALFTGVPQFPAKQSEVTVCSASGVQSKYGMHPFKAAYGFYAFDFKKVDIKDAVISLYSGIQTVSTGCNNFIAAVATGESLASRPHSLVVPITVGSNYTVIVSSQSGQGALYELLVIAGNAQ